MTGLPSADRFSDARTDDPYWNENSWFSVSIPERRIHGLIQHFFRPNMGLLNGGPVLWDPSGTFQWNCLHYGWSHLQAAPEGAGKFDFTARNSLSVKVLEPLWVRAGGEEEALGRWVAQLEGVVGERPTQWFNFFSVWAPYPSSSGASAPDPSGADGRRRLRRATIDGG